MSEFINKFSGRAVIALTTAVLSVSCSKSIPEPGSEVVMAAKEVKAPAPALSMPVSAFLSEESRKSWETGVAGIIDLGTKWNKDCGSLQDSPKEKLPELRQCMAEIYYASPVYKRLKESYAVEVQGKTIAGVYTEVFTPSDGIAPHNKDRVLINLHGGGFMHGSRTNSHYGSMPFAAKGKIKVVSVDYRMAPEHRFPAASDDVLNVYKALLEEYQPENIGIYGCSAGAMLTAQSIARFQKEGLPLPGAVGMLCGGASAITGDSAHIAAAISGAPSPDSKYRKMKGYFEGVDASNPLAFPAESPEIMAKFPPSLLITSTRDYLLSSVVATHTQLVGLGVEADLHVYEGLEHAFMGVPDLPESRQVYDVVVKFFNKNLGRQ